MCFESAGSGSDAFKNSVLFGPLIMSCPLYSYLPTSTPNANHIGSGLFFDFWESSAISSGKIWHEKRNLEESYGDR